MDNIEPLAIRIVNECQALIGQQPKNYPHNLSYEDMQTHLALLQHQQAKLGGAQELIKWSCFVSPSIRINIDAWHTTITRWIDEIQQQQENKQ